MKYTKYFILLGLISAIFSTIAYYYAGEKQMATVWSLVVIWTLSNLFSELAYQKNLKKIDNIKNAVTESDNCQTAIEKIEKIIF